MPSFARCLSPCLTTPVLLIGVLVTGGVPASPAAAETTTGDTTIEVGPWKVDAVLRNGKFKNCAMSRTTEDGVDVDLVRDAKGYELRLASAKWKLGTDKTYPVELVAGSFILKADVDAAGDAVSVRLTDDRFISQLAQASELDVKGAGATIRVALDRSSAALDRLEACYKKNSSATSETNPFVAPKHNP